MRSEPCFFGICRQSSPHEILPDCAALPYRRLRPPYCRVQYTGSADRISAGTDPGNRSGDGTYCGSTRTDIVCVIVGAFLSGRPVAGAGQLCGRRNRARSLVEKSSGGNKKFRPDPRRPGCTPRHLHPLDSLQHSVIGAGTIRYASGSCQDRVKFRGKRDVRPTVSSRGGNAPIHIQSVCSGFGHHPCCRRPAFCTCVNAGPCTGHCKYYRNLPAVGPLRVLRGPGEQSGSLPGHPSLWLFYPDRPNRYNNRCPG